MIDTSAPALRTHAIELSKAFDVRLIESALLRPDEALSMSHLRVALCAPIVDETTYAVALHEMGHLAHPTGIVRDASTANLLSMKQVEERSAWEWAKHYALVWSPLMQSVASWAEQTYHPTARPIAPSTPTIDPKTHIKTIEWSHYK